MRPTLISLEVIKFTLDKALCVDSAYTKQILCVHYAYNLIKFAYPKCTQCVHISSLLDRLYINAYTTTNLSPDYKLYQQDLNPCCVLVLTTQKVVALFIVTGLILLPVGIALLFSSRAVSNI